MQFLGDPLREGAMHERGLDVLDRVAGIRPVGYRSPGWDLTWESVDILLELGFEYDSRLAADDFSLYSEPSVRPVRDAVEAFRRNQTGSTAAASGNQVD
jgi:peptidoglycan/xylan/chitin deacetylase (PgdA/CDA1 family)